MQLLLSTRKGLIQLVPEGTGWRTLRLSFPGVAVSYATRDPRDGRIWACLDHGHWGQKLHYSADDGATWQEVAAPKYPEGAEVKPGVPAVLRYLWVFEPGPADQPGRLYLGTEPGGLFRSDDGGASWNLVSGLWDQPTRTTHWMGGGRDHPGIHSIVIDPRNSRHVRIGISCAGVFETLDDGVSWRPTNRGLKASYLPDPSVEVGHDPHLLVACAGAPEVLWQQNHCGIFRSTDGGAQWTDVGEAGGPAHFGFAIAADPASPDTAWVVPAHSDEQRLAPSGAVCVCRTDDGGASWQAFRTGLPQRECYDIVLRHALDYREDRLVIGSTTGNVYVSADRGVSWSCVGNHFPPVYAARFA
jgi:hypothetical protein